MGILFSRFRKKQETYEILKNLETKIKEIEEYRQNTEQRHKKIVGRLIVYSVALYIVAALVFYFYFFPAALYDQIFYMTPLLIFPILILFTKNLVSWYYKRKISRNQSKLSTMQHEKRKILDDVVETETYKKAKEILLKFAPDRLKMTSLSPQPTPLKTLSLSETPIKATTPKVPTTTSVPSGGSIELRRRTLPISSFTSNKQIGRLVNSGPIPVGTVPPHTPQFDNNYPTTLATRQFNTPATAPRAPLPRPILSQQRSYLDRLVEYLVGDGPSNRYALICRQCESHNGMALKEEFEYFGFRCCYCNFWNPARKQKPSAPRLEHDVSVAAPPTPGFNIGQVTSPKIVERTSSSDTDSDIEVVEKPGNVGDESTEQKSGHEKEDAKTPISTVEASASKKSSEENSDGDKLEKLEGTETETSPVSKTESETEKMEVDGSP